MSARLKSSPNQMCASGGIFEVCPLGRKSTTACDPRGPIGRADVEMSLTFHLQSYPEQLTCRLRLQVSRLITIKFGIYQDEDAATIISL